MTYVLTMPGPTKIRAVLHKNKLAEEFYMVSSIAKKQSILTKAASF